MGTLVLAIATSSVALAAGGPEHDREARTSEPPAGAGQQGAAATSAGATDDTGHHAPAPTPAPPTTADADAELSGAAMPGADGADWAARLDRAQVRQVQQELSSHGIYHGPIDGLAGPQTLEALQTFQAQQGLPAHARLDAQTRRALGLELDMQPVSGDATSAGPGLQPSVGRDTADPTSPGSGSAPLKLDTLEQQQLGALQARLLELGFYRGSVDGKLGAGTRSALQRFFQAQAELASRGMLAEAAASWLGVEAGARPAPSSSSGSGEPAATMPHPQPSTP